MEKRKKWWYPDVAATKNHKITQKTAIICGNLVKIQAKYGCVIRWYKAISVKKMKLYLCKTASLIISEDIFKCFSLFCFTWNIDFRLIIDHFGHFFFKLEVLYGIFDGFGKNLGSFGHIEVSRIDSSLRGNLSDMRFSVLVSLINQGVFFFF